MNKTYYVAKSHKNGNFNFITDREKVSETIFSDLLSAKIKELLGCDPLGQYDKWLREITEALEAKKPVTICDRTFEINFKKVKNAKEKI